MVDTSFDRCKSRSSPIFAAVSSAHVRIDGNGDLEEKLIIQ